jgi:hypothetical protein
MFTQNKGKWPRDVAVQFERFLLNDFPYERGLGVGLLFSRKSLLINRSFDEFYEENILSFKVQ